MMRRWNEGLNALRVRTRDRSLHTAGEKQFVLYQGPPMTPPNWLRFSPSFSFANVFGVENSVPDEFEQVAMKLVGSGSRHDVHRSRRVEAVLGRYGAGFDLELLNRIGEWQRQSLIEGQRTL